VTEPRLIYVRTAAGEVHVVTERNGVRSSYEGCNLDDAPGTEAEITAGEVSEVEPDRLCQHPSCFGEVG
jgi:hypothetical protein